MRPIMGFRDRVLGPLDDGGEEAPDYWRIAYMEWNGDGGFQALSDEWDKLDDPPDRETFEWNTGRLEDGRYKLMAIKEGRMRRPDDFGVKGWVMDVGEPDDAPRERDDLERKVDLLLAQQDQDDDDELEMPADPEALIQWMTLQDPRLLERYGDAIIPAAWGASAPGGGVGYSDFEDNPLGAILFDAYNNPEKLRKAGENIGAGFGSGLDGFFRGMEEPESIGPPDDGADQDAGEDVDDEPREFGAGATMSLEELREGPEGGPSFDDFVRARQGAEEAPSEPAAEPEPETPPEAPDDDERPETGQQDVQEDAADDAELSDAAEDEIDEAVAALEGTG